MIGILGDGTASTTYSLKMAGATKNNIVPSAEVSGTLLRQVTRADCPLASGFTGSIRASKIGNLVVINIAGLSSTVTTSAQICTVPAGYRPEKALTVQLMGYTKSGYYSCYLNPNGAIGVDITDGQGLSSCYGCVVFGTSNTDSGSNVFNYPVLKMNGVSKTLLQVNNANLTCRTTQVAGSGATWYLWKLGRFVCGNVWAFSPQQTGAFNNKTLVTLPVGFRPAATSYSSGFGFTDRSVSPQPASGNRIAITINTNGNVQGYSKTGFPYADLACGASFYFYSAD
jgi:hypothetical protein